LDNGPFGLWVNGLFSVVPGSGYFEEFHEKKEAFFYLLERLLEEGRVVLDVPGDIEYSSTKVRAQDGYTDIWDESVEVMVSYMRKTFPADAQHEYDSVLTDYWYSAACPHIGWVHPETGELVFS